MRRWRNCGAVLALAIAVPVGAQSSGASETFARSDKGHCIACHQLPDGLGPPTRADLGPKLEGARMRGLGKPRLREIIVDPMRANPETLMPPFGRHRILDTAEIDALVEFLHALP